MASHHGIEGFRFMPNRLGGETSPYLLQHKDNPVEWYPWGPEAMAAAALLDKPILLSVGYSACHWCHVMERESFEDPQIAALMNQLFVNIKVDREERPDVDSVYMAAVAGDDRPRGLADDGFPDAGGSAILRWDVLSTGGPGRNAVVPAGAAIGGTRVQDASRRHPRQFEPGDRPHSGPERSARERRTPGPRTAGPCVIGGDERRRS